jgi:hypothetical protein
MCKKTLVVLLVGLALPSFRLAQAQQQVKIPKIGALRAQPASSPAPPTSYSSERSVSSAISRART